MKTVQACIHMIALIRAGNCGAISLNLCCQEVDAQRIFMADPSKQSAVRHVHSLGMACKVPQSVCNPIMLYLQRLRLQACTSLQVKPCIILERYISISYGHPQVTTPAMMSSCHCTLAQQVQTKDADQRWPEQCCPTSLPL